MQIITAMIALVIASSAVQGRAQQQTAQQVIVLTVQGMT